MKTRSKVYLHYDPKLTIKEIAQRAGVSVTAVKNFITKNGLGTKHQQNFFLKLRSVESAVNQLAKSNKKPSISAIAELTELSERTVQKYLKVLDEKTAKKSSEKVAYFANSNSSVVKSVSDDQSQILAWALKLYSRNKAVDFDLTYSSGGFYKNGIEKPKHKFDKFPLSEDIGSLEEAEKLAVNYPNSLYFGVADPPHTVSRGQSLGENGLTKKEGSNMISHRFSCFSTPQELYESNEYLLSLSSKLLAKDGVLFYKIQDTVSSGKQIFSHLFVIEKAKEYGFDLVDIFILTAKNRIISPKHANQKHARKYHSFILILKKITENTSAKKQWILGNEMLLKAMWAAFSASVPVMDIYRSGTFNERKKEDATKITDGDMASHKEIEKLLKRTKLPIISEESYQKDELPNSDKYWLVDPIDGTREYITNGVHFSINIALIENNRPIISVMLFPALKTLYFAAKGEGAYKVENVSKIEEVYNNTEASINFH